jgi:hypothetical protein
MISMLSRQAAVKLTLQTPLIPIAVVTDWHRRLEHLNAVLVIHSYGGVRIDGLYAFPSLSL